MSELLLSTNGLTKQYGHHKAVDKVNLHIKKGAIYGFIGRNGAGKTTCLKMISGLARPTAGEIEMFGCKGKELERIRSRVGCLIEAPGLYGNMNAYTNLKIKCELFGIRKKGYIEDILETVGLEGVGKKKTKHFSLGMKQRLGIGLALVGEPDLLVLDEPINGLDPQGIAEVRDTIQRLRDERNMTILISSHILEELSKIATDYGIIHNGSLLQELTSEELMKRCSERIEIELIHPEQAVPILDRMGFTNYQVTDKSHIHIFERLNESANVNMELAKAGILVNGIKMDLYRMVRTKSMYVVWIVMAAAIFFSTSMSKLDIDTMNKEAEQQQTENIAETVKPETINMGMSVFLPTQPGEKVTVFDQVYANLQAKFVALFLVIFTVLFSSADIGSGYIKNIGGQVRSRRNLIFSKASVLFVYTTVTMLLYFIIQIIAQQMYFGYLEWGNGSELLRYFGIQILLHYALVLISMAIAVVLNSNVFSMTIVICLCMNTMIVLYGVINHLIQKAGVENFQILKYTVTGKIALLSMSPTNKECLTAVVIAAAFGIVVTLLTAWVFRKRDI